MLSIQAPAPWAQPLPWRACQLCTHGTQVAGVQMCRCKAAVQPLQHQPVELMRRQHGLCGPEAEFLDFPGLRA